MFDRREVSKALSRSATASVLEILDGNSDASPRRARVIGVTGAPGAGKSSLIGRLVAARLQRIKTVAIVAIDPTSPRSDGSFLGDRVRLSALAEDPRVFIRSLPSRTSEDGLTDNVSEIIETLDRFGFDEIVIETVGAGQATHGVHVLADATILVLNPGGGDHIQAMKAGIMETADIYVVAKSDLPGADRVVADVLGVSRHDRQGRAPPVIQVRQDQQDGIAELDEAVVRRLAQRRPDDGAAEHSRARRQLRVRKLAQRRLAEAIAAMPDSAWEKPLRASYDELMRRIADGS